MPPRRNTQTDVLEAGTKPGAQREQFRIDAAPPGSALLVGDVAVLNCRGQFCAPQVTVESEIGRVEKEN
jgi:hypothetical protein